MSETRRDREWALQNRFGPIVGISDLSDADFDALEQSAAEYDVWKRNAYREPSYFKCPAAVSPKP